MRCVTRIYKKTKGGQSRTCDLPGRECLTCSEWVCRYHWVTWHFEHEISPPFMKMRVLP